MAINGLEKTGVWFEGVKYVTQAHFPKSEDYQEATHDTYEAAILWVEGNRAKGANCQLHEHKWTEMFVASGWYPARIPA